MVTESFIYWFTRLDHLHDFGEGLSFFLSIVVLASGIAWLASFVVKCGLKSDRSSGNSWSKVSTTDIAIAKTICSISRKAFLYLVAFTTILNLSRAFIPTTKEMAAIYVVPKIANNENLHDIGNEMVVLAKEWLKELHPKNVSNDIAQQATAVANSAVSNVIDKAKTGLTK